jgi:hypothetical protein
VDPVTGELVQSQDISQYKPQDFGASADADWDSYAANLQELADSGGFTSQWKLNGDGTRTMTSDDGSTMTVDSDGNILGVTDATDTFYNPDVVGNGKSAVTAKIAANSTPQGRVARMIANAQTNLTPLDSSSFNSLIGMLGGQSQQTQGPLMPFFGTVGDIQSMNDIFGGDVQLPGAGDSVHAASGGSPDDLINLLRG